MSEQADSPTRNPVTLLLVGIVRAYQLIVSPWLAPRCRYYPSCSAYAVSALRVHGPVRGAALAAWRLLRCNPWSLGGVDHVPPRPDRGRPHAPARTPDVLRVTTAPVAGAAPSES